jgi:hypothetical protein
MADSTAEPTEDVQIKVASEGNRERIFLDFPLPDK